MGVVLPNGVFHHNESCICLSISDEGFMTKKGMLTYAKG